MHSNQRTVDLEPLTRRADHMISGPNRNSDAAKPIRDHLELYGARGTDVIEEQSARIGFNSVIQNARMTFCSFVETKFIPEHVEHKTLAGRTHYQAMLKHLIRPETVQRMFNPRKVSNARLQSDPDWPYVDQVRLCDLKPEHVRRLVAAGFARNYSWQTVKHVKNVLFAIIAHAQQEGCFHGINPVSQVKLPPKTHTAASDLSLNQTMAILQLLPSPEKHVALFALNTGMNVQEICNLRWKHVNLTDSPRVLEGAPIPPYSIAVRMQWNRTGLGSASQSRNRNISVPVALFAVLANWALEKTPDPAEFVLGSDTGQALSPADLSPSRLVGVGRRLGIPRLCWRALCRAHVMLFPEFRPRFHSIAADDGFNGLGASAQRDQHGFVVFTRKSDTIESGSPTTFLLPVSEMQS